MNKWFIFSKAPTDLKSLRLAGVRVTTFAKGTHSVPELENWFKSGSFACSIKTIFWCGSGVKKGDFERLAANAVPVDPPPTIKTSILVAKVLKCLDVYIIIQ